MLDCSPRAHCDLHNYMRPMFGRAAPRFYPSGGGRPPTATAIFEVQAHSYEVAANGASAAVGLPQLDYSGTRQAELFLHYQFPSASSYDWSSFPADFTPEPSSVTWSETLPPSLFPSVTSARVASGINHSAETHDSNFTLAAGVLFGLGGGAFVAAVQEALHAND